MKGLLVKEVAYWGGFNIYEYDKNGRMISNTDYTKTGEKHHITHYKYSGNLKIEEWKEVSYTGSRIYLRKFRYDSKNRLTEVIENDKLVEENFYDENRLIEKREYYFGIDPGYFACNGNYIYKYEY
jgi:hypothetical protein